MLHLRNKIYGFFSYTCFSLAYCKFMDSMYDSIRHLPLFKGVTEDDITSFLEKTKIDVRNYVDGDVIIDYGEIVNRLGFVLSGNIIYIKTLCEGDIVVKVRLGSGVWLLPELLFGMSHECRSHVESVGETSVLWLTKGKLWDLMNSNVLCSVNYINHLCYRAQCREENLNIVSEGEELKRFIEFICINGTERRAASVEILFKEKKLADLLRISEYELLSQIQNLINQNAISYSKGIISVENRRDYF